MTTTALIVFFASFLIVLWAGRMLPPALKGLALIFHLPEFVIAFVLVAAATSMPELFVGISSAAQGVSTLSLGNIFGANLANMTFVIGIAAIIVKKIPQNGEISKQNFWLVAALVFFPLFLAFDGVISRADGLALLVVFGMYFAKIFHDRHYFRKASQHGKNEPPGLHSSRNVFVQISHFSLSLALLIGSSFTLIWAARILAETYFSSNFFLFGTLFLSIGTTLPELAFAIRAAGAGQTGAIIGNALGTVAFNGAGIVGLVALLHPIEYALSREGFLVAGALFLSFAFFYLSLYAGKGIGRAGGVLLIALYLVFAVVTLFF